MALKPCKECKKEVSTSAKTCPHCGVANPAVGPKETAIGLGLVAFIATALMFACSDSEEKKQADAAKSAETHAACMKDLQCIGDQGTISAGLKCPREIEKLAKGEVKWTDGTLEPKFSRFRWKDEKAGIVTHIGDKVQFQNGFGAFVNVIYTCDLDMKVSPGEVAHVSASEGRL